MATRFTAEMLQTVFSEEHASFILMCVREIFPEPDSCYPLQCRETTDVDSTRCVDETG